MNYLVDLVYIMLAIGDIASQNISARGIHSKTIDRKPNTFKPIVKYRHLNKTSQRGTVSTRVYKISYSVSSNALSQSPVKTDTTKGRKPILSKKIVSKPLSKNKTSACITKKTNQLKTITNSYDNYKVATKLSRTLKKIPKKTKKYVGNKNGKSNNSLGKNSTIVRTGTNKKNKQSSSSTSYSTQNTSLGKAVVGSSISTDFTCGIQNGDTICDPDSIYGPCCSQYGYCGSTPEYCSSLNNCQSGCKEIETANPTIYSDSDRCGTSNNGLLCDPFGSDGPCCSEYGWCGKTNDFCLPSNGCQSGCLADTPEYSQVETCGSANNGLMCDPNGAFGPCCSSSGKCGSGDDFCKPANGCQNGCEIVSETPLSTCGDGFCDKRGETCYSCPNDCGQCNLSYIDNCVGTGHISLTIDDGPDIFSDNLLKICKQLGVKLTHFIIGKKLANPAYQTFLKNFHDAGHAIASHTFTHPFITHLTDQQLRTEMLMTDYAIYSIIGANPIYMRNPYSDSNERTMALLQSMGYESIFTSLDTQDTVYGNSNPSMILQIVNSILNNSSSNSNSFVLTQHETFNSSINYIPDIVKAIRSKGYDMPLIDSCRGQPSIYRNDICGDGDCTGWTETCKTCPADCGVCP